MGPTPVTVICVESMIGLSDSACTASDFRIRSTCRFQTLPSFRTTIYDLGAVHSAIVPGHQTSLSRTSFTSTRSPGKNSLNLECSWCAAF